MKPKSESQRLNLTQSQQANQLEYGLGTVQPQPFFTTLLMSLHFELALQVLFVSNLIVPNCLI
jgi:hypothetical protein